MVQFKNYSEMFRLTTLVFFKNVLFYKKKFNLAKIFFYKIK